jgi:hypothetical protein
VPTVLAIRPWLPEPVDDRVTSTLNLLAGRDVTAVEQWLQDLVVDNQPSTTRPASTSTRPRTG